MPFVILPTNSASGGYDLTNSLRFNNSSSDSLTRTAGTFTSRDIFTVSAWVKFSGIGGTNQNPIISFDGSNQYMAIRFGSTSFDFDNISYQGSTIGRIISSAVYRDFSAWYHVLVAIDSTQATASNRMRSYINGVEVTAFSSTTYPTQNTDMISASMTTIRVGAGVDQTGTTSYFGGYMSDVFYIDGQQLTPSSFGETDFDTGIWKPKAYTGSYGTNGFYLQFKNSASLGTDSSGNGNNFTVNNLTSIDQTTDTPTNNFATLNPLNTGSGTLSEGNLKWVTTDSTGYLTFATIAIDMDLTNKFYCEMKLNSSGGIVLGIAPTTLRGSDTGRAGSYGYYSGDGNKYSGTSASAYGSSFTTNDIIGMLAGNGTLTFYKNGVSQGTAFSGLTGTYILFLAEISCDVSMNFGNPPFTISSSETDPSGFGNFEYSTNGGYALNTKNLANFG
jgi:hypothetical protein